jgi:hypothetical protein
MPWLQVVSVCKPARTLIPPSPPRSSPLPFNYGVVCGPANGITVVDVDDYKSIKNTKLLKGMMDILSTPACKTYTVATPSGGKHF